MAAVLVLIHQVLVHNVNLRHGVPDAARDAQPCPVSSDDVRAMQGRLPDAPGDAHDRAMRFSACGSAEGLPAGARLPVEYREVAALC